MRRTRGRVLTMMRSDCDNRWLLRPSCKGGITEVDLDLGQCTQCGCDLINNSEDWEDDALLQMDHELIREELSK